MTSRVIYLTRKPLSSRIEKNFSSPLCVCIYLPQRVEVKRHPLALSLGAPPP
jgi:hypothetical protein